MSNKKLNLKSEQLSRSLWLSNEFYKDGVDKIIGKVYKNSGVPRFPDVPQYIPTSSLSIFNTDQPLSFSIVPSNYSGDAKYNAVTQYLYDSTPFYCCYCGYMEEHSFDTPTDTSGDYQTHIGCDYVILTCFPPTSSTTAYEVAYSAVYRLMDGPTALASGYFDNETSEHYELLKAFLADIQSCYGWVFYIPVEDEYPQYHYKVDSESVFGYEDPRWLVYKVMSYDRNSVYSVDAYNGFIFDQNLVENNKLGRSPIMANADDVDGWYWNGYGWNPYYERGNLNTDKVKEIINEMSLTSVTTSAFKFPTLDLAAVIDDYGFYINSSNNRNVVNIPPIRVMKIPNFNSALTYLITIPGNSTILSSISSGSAASSARWMHIDEVSIDKSCEFTLSKSGSSENCSFSIDNKGYLKLSFSMSFSTNIHGSFSSGSDFVGHSEIASRLINAGYISPVISTDAYKCNLKNYMSSTTMSRIDSADGRAFSDDELSDVCLFSTQALSDVNCGYGDYRYSFALRFTPKVSGTYTILYTLETNPQGDDNISIRFNVGINPAPNDVSSYNGRTIGISPTYPAQYDAGIEITCDADEVQYIHINSTGAYFSLNRLEIYGLPTVNTTDKGAQPPDNSLYIQDVYYNPRSYQVTTSSTKLSNTMSTDNLKGWVQVSVIDQFDTRVQ